METSNEQFVESFVNFLNKVKPVGTGYCYEGPHMEVLSSICRAETIVPLLVDRLRLINFLPFLPQHFLFYKILTGFY